MKYGLVALVALAMIGCGDDDDGGGTADATVSNPDAPVGTPDAPVGTPDAPTSSADALPPPPNIIISEILYDPTGSDDGNEWVEIQNAGLSQVDVGGHRLCGANFSYYTLPANIPLAAGERILVHWNTTGTDGTPAGHYYTGAKTPMGNMGTVAGDKSMAIYTPAGSFGSSANILDYVQWVAGNQARADVAMTAGIWTATEFVNGVAEGSSLCFNGGATDGPSGFSEDTSPTPLADNGSCN
jgi:hypothetical protein